MKYPVAEKTVNSRLAAGAAATYAALSLEPTSYSIPDPVAISPAGNGVIHAIHSAATLPGCAARVSLDVPVGQDSHACGKLLSLSPPHTRTHLSPQLCKAARGLFPPPLSPSVAAPSGGGCRGQLLHQQHSNHKPEQIPPELGQQQQRAKWEAVGVPRTLRTSVDAASRAQLLGTCAVADMSLQHPYTHLDRDPTLAFRGRAATAPMNPSTRAQAAPPVPRLSAPPPGEQAPYEWSFGESLQHARIVARYAAMDAAGEVQYEASAGGRGSDSDEDSSSRKARGAWKVLATLLGTSKVQKFGNGGPMPSQGGSSGGGARPERADVGGGGDDEPAAKVVRSRDSRRLLRAYRSRVGIDREGQRPPRPLVPAVSMVRALASEDTADPATAAVIAAAAAFATAAMVYPTKP